MFSFWVQPLQTHTLLTVVVQVCRTKGQRLLLLNDCITVTGRPSEGKPKIDIQVCISWKKITKTGIHITWTQYWVLPWESSKIWYDDHEWKKSKCTMWMAQHVFHDDDEEGWTEWGVVYELTQVFLYDVESSGLFERLIDFKSWRWWWKMVMIIVAKSWRLW